MTGFSKSVSSSTSDPVRRNTAREGELLKAGNIGYALQNWGKISAFNDQKQKLGICIFETWDIREFAEFRFRICKSKTTQIDVISTQMRASFRTFTQHSFKVPYNDT